MSTLGLVNPALLVNCTLETCDITTSFYNYEVDLGANIAFLILFALLLVVYITLWIITRRCHTFGFTMVLGLDTEIAGYAGRIWSHYNPWKDTAYFLQLCSITIAPASFAAGIYLCLGWIVLIYGHDNSRVNPQVYPLAVRNFPQSHLLVCCQSANMDKFMPCDTLSLLLQLAGGVVAAVALSDGRLDGINQGIDLLTAGLAFQVFTLLVFLIVGIDLALLIRRRRRKMGDAAALSQDLRHVAARQSKLFLWLPWSLLGATLLILWRCIFRLVEFNDGFNGPVTFDQGLFIGMESSMVFLAVGVMAVFHPSICMGEGVTMELPR